jgi:hypothetical protein
MNGLKDTLLFSARAGSRRHRNMLWAAGLLVALTHASCSQPKSVAPAGSGPAAPSQPPAAPAPASIGVATMDANGTLILDLRAEDGKGTVGSARLTYPPTHPQYQSILTHLGGMKPGESKPVPPFPEK